MDTTSNNGPAFPTLARGIDNDAGGASFYTMDGGLSARDYFAAKAMQGELAAMVIDHEADQSIAGLALNIPNESLARLATHWYRIADAMLVARAA